MPESSHATGQDGSGATRCSSEGLSDTCGGPVKGLAPGRDACLRRITAAGIRYAAQARRYTKLLDHRITKAIALGVLADCWARKKRAERDLLAAAKQLARTPAGEAALRRRVGEDDQTPIDEAWLRRTHLNPQPRPAAGGE